MSNPVLSPNNFVPAEVSGYLGSYTRTPGQIKVEPEDFVVEEQPSSDHQCTVLTQSDRPEYDLSSNPSRPDFATVTLVKRQMTTFDAVYRLASSLGVEPDRVSYGGLKDRWAVTAQRVNIRLGPRPHRPTPLTMEEVVRSCCPEKIQGTGFFIKDASVAAGRLNKGQLVGNRFTIKVRLPGMSARQIEEYVVPRLEHLSAQDNKFPNAYGRQRLGFRQSLLTTGETLITKGAAAAIKQFLTETSPNEKPFPRQLREQLLEQWNKAEAEAAASPEPITVDKLEWYFHVMREILEPHYKKLNMSIEYKIIEKTLDLRDFDLVMARLKDEFSLWVGAYQSFWYNQMLARVMRGETKLGPDNEIPLFMNDPAVIAWYKDHGCPGAIPESMNPTVARMFLRGNGFRKRRNQKRWPVSREAFIQLQNLTHTCEDGVWNVSFVLRSGSYATTFLGFMFDLEGDDTVVEGV